MADNLFARMFRHKCKNEREEKDVGHFLLLDDLSTSEQPRTPQIGEDDEFVDNIGKNEEFINLDGNFVDGANLYENVDGNGVSYMNQLFQILDETDNSFRAYTLRNGFAIKIQATHQRNQEKDLYGRLYVYKLSGKSVAAKSSKAKQCREALPKIKCKDITNLEWVHNYSHVSPIKMNLVQRERHMNTATRSLIKTLYGSGVRNCQVMNFIGNPHRGNDKVGFGAQHVRNVKIDERKKMFGISDSQAGLDLLHSLNKESGSKYFIRTEIDEENHLKCLEWIDPTCLMAYQNFGDVVAFDTTYRTNRYVMPFVHFTGVNHHYQSVIFGYALMRDEHTTNVRYI
ncbi:protein FAR1-RELATED SEQUENCE 5-like [Apium graveolens]|uniref:protein FAR1-RELATED SEQUENCE 5-like n=1 Tax=Apium graveolens TaxID=4045 RepID=UPI003D7B4E91